VSATVLSRGAPMAQAMRVGLGVLGGVLLIAIWTGASFGLGESRLPLPTSIVEKFATTITASPDIKFQGGGSDGFLPHVIATAWHFLVGTLAGVSASGVALLAAGRFPSFRTAVDPYIAILRTIPPLAIAPFLLLWFGTATTAQALLVGFYVFVMIYPPGVLAIERIEPSLVGFASTLGASRTTIALEILLPALVPAVAGPLQVAVSWSWGLVVVGEILGARQGLGKLLAGFVPITATDLTIVDILWILLLAVISETILSILLKRATRWTA
jgi:ABC-type nitrate/sulfonate/bicarbonate transport system permease component